LIVITAIDAVFTDISMPEMTGWELVTRPRTVKSVALAIVGGWTDAISVIHPKLDRAE
jgi:CheY-like chemotaxis protein